MFEEVLDSTKEKFALKIQSFNVPIKWKIVHQDLNPKKDGTIGDVTIISNKLKNVTDYDLLIVINDDIFAQLEEKYQYVVVDKMLAKVVYDLDKGMFKSSTPDFKEYSGVLEKHSYATVIEGLSEIRRIHSSLEEQKQASDGQEL